LGKIHEIYTGTGFDAERLYAAGDGTTSNSHELTAITSANIGNSDYIVVETLVSAGGDVQQISSTSDCHCDLKIETKEVGGSYSDSMAQTMILSIESVGSSSYSSQTGSIQTKTVKWVHLLSAGEKTNGVQVKITGSATLNNTSGNIRNSSIANVQTVISGGYA